MIQMQDETPKILVGVCAMEKKVNGKPMQNILKCLKEYTDIKIVTFPEDVIRDQPIEDWPKCDALICFYSAKFPMDKAIDYVKEYKPIQVNDLVA